MSDYFKGVTFPWQEVTPSDDAIVRRAILPDRCLSGCELTYSGYTLTMAAGSMIVCGRQFKHTAAQNWAITGATSGYARLLLTIDVTKASTEDSFEQIATSIEYASAVDGFSVLRQDDINSAGTIYQVGICVVALGAGGITRIVSSLTKGNLDSDDVGAVPTTRKINGKALRTDIALSASDVGALPLAGGTMAGPLNMGTNSITYLADPTGSMQAANKRYVDDSVRASVSSASNDYHTAHFAKIGKLVICTLLPKTAGTTALYQEDITIPTGYYPAANTTFTIYTTLGGGGNATVRAYANGILRVLRTAGVSVEESSKTYCWVTA